MKVVLHVRMAVGERGRANGLTHSYLTPSEQSGSHRQRSPVFRYAWCSACTGALSWRQQCHRCRFRDLLGLGVWWRVVTEVGVGLQTRLIVRVLGDADASNVAEAGGKQCHCDGVV